MNHEENENKEKFDKIMDLKNTTIRRCLYLYFLLKFIVEMHELYSFVFYHNND